MIPTRTFEPEGASLKRAAEEENLYKRWEWFTQPRSIPPAAGITRKSSPRCGGYGRRYRPAGTGGGTGECEVAAHMVAAGTVGCRGQPNLGRVNAIAFDPTNTNTLYIGSADGGLWKSTTSGTAWTPLTDALPTLSIGDIAIDPAAPNTIYIATGDAFGYGNPFWGGTYSMGVWKSIDGGHIWLPTGLTLAVGQTRTIRRLAINPTNPKILLAATSAGLFRTADAGVTWNSLWATSTFDVEFNPSDGNIVYATTNQVLKSTNAGASFTPTSATCGGARYNIEVAKSIPTRSTRSAPTQPCRSSPTRAAPGRRRPRPASRSTATTTTSSPSHPPMPTSSSSPAST